MDLRDVWRNFMLESASALAQKFCLTSAITQSGKRFNLSPALFISGLSLARTRQILEFL